MRACFKGAGSILLAGALSFAATPSPSPVPASTPPPRVESLLKPAVFRRITQDREVQAHAELEKLSDAELATFGLSPAKAGEDPVKRYSFYASMRVRASHEQARRTLTDYPLYAKMIPYVDRTDYDEKSKTLLVEGGIWKFRLRSVLQIEEEKDQPRIRFNIISGHFTGLKGELVFEPYAGETLVYLRGTLLGRRWPPAIVIERGAEIVFGFTGGRMRSYIESQKEDPKKEKQPHDPTAPQPRSRL